MGRKPDPYLIDDEAPELSDDELASARPGRAVLPSKIFDALVASEPKRRPGQRGQGKKPAKEPVTLRLDAEIVAHFRATGPGWQKRISNVVRDATVGRIARPALAATETTSKARRKIS